MLSGAVQGRIETVKRGLNVAYGNTQDPGLEAALDAPLHQLTADTEKLLAAVNSDSSSPAAVADAASKMIEAQFAFQVKTTDALDNLMQARQNDYVFKSQRVEVIAGVALALVLYLLVGFNRSVKGSAAEIGNAGGGGCHPAGPSAGRHRYRQG